MATCSPREVWSGCAGREMWMVQLELGAGRQQPGATGPLRTCHKGVPSLCLAPKDGARADL